MKEQIQQTNMKLQILLKGDTAHTQTDTKTKKNSKKLHDHLTNRTIIATELPTNSLIEIKRRHRLCELRIHLHLKLKV